LPEQILILLPVLWFWVRVPKVTGIRSIHSKPANFLMGFIHQQCRLIFSIPVALQELRIKTIICTETYLQISTPMESL